MKAINLESLLGNAFDDEIIKEAIDYFALPKERPRIPSGNSYIGIESPTKGIDINFSPVEYIDYLDQERYPEGTLLATAIFLYRNGIDGHSQFENELPHHLTFSTTRTDASKILGNPSWSSPMLPIDRWVYGRHQMIIDFSKNEEQINILTLQLIRK
jgi:hypothetical protein